MDLLDVFARRPCQLLHRQGHDRGAARERGADVLLEEDGVGEMAGGIAHEINNPLQIIHGSSSLLRKLVQRQPINTGLLTKTAETIESTAVRIAKITQGLRTFAREGKNDPFETRGVSVLVEDTLSFCSEKFKVHKIELRIAAIPKELSIACRPGQ